jgi:hypothetical protein
MLFHAVYNLQIFLKRVGSGENMGRLEGEAGMPTDNQCPPWLVNISAKSKNTFLDF